MFAHYLLSIIKATPVNPSDFNNPFKFGDGIEYKSDDSEEVLSEATTQPNAELSHKDAPWYKFCTENMDYYKNQSSEWHCFDTSLFLFFFQMMIHQHMIPKNMKVMNDINEQHMTKVLLFSFHLESSFFSSTNNFRG